MSVLIETTVGDLVVDLFLKERPNACKNFLKLCKVKYYNLCQFFTIEPNYIAQTGDPSNSGRGGESIHGILFGDQARYFEMEKVPKIRHSRRGLISMVNNGAGLIGSQFFITLADNLDFLDGKHCIFGQVAEGFDTVTKLNEQIVDDNNRPYRDVRIAHTIVLDDPFDDPSRLQIPRRSPSPTLDLIKLENQMALDERVDEDEGKSADEVKKELEQKDMRAQAEILTMVGDLHHVEERPPDNVLFVCKLNPVTTDEDLEVIFSRFGTIVKCEVIKDRRTAASLQYAFVEFEQPEQCEQAFLKMDNVLIDDRRIHVDFSQSVSKNFQWNPKTDKDAKPAPNADKGADRANKVSHKEQQRRPAARRSSPPAAAKSSTPRQHSSPRHGSTSSSRHRHRNGEGGGAEERRDDRRPREDDRRPPREDDRRRRDSSRERQRNGDNNEKRRRSSRSREREEQQRRRRGHREEEEERRGDRGGARGRDHRGGGGDDDRRRHSRR